MWLSLEYPGPQLNLMEWPRHTHQGVVAGFTSIPTCGGKNVAKKHMIGTKLPLIKIRVIRALIIPVLFLQKLWQRASWIHDKVTFPQTQNFQNVSLLYWKFKETLWCVVCDFHFIQAHLLSVRWIQTRHCQTAHRYHDLLHIRFCLAWSDAFAFYLGSSELPWHCDWSYC